jgi:LysR family glycine cleavage system transcriptional activator
MRSAVKNVPRGVELSNAGAQYLAEISPAFDQISAATDNLSDAPEGTLSISCEQTFAYKWLMSNLGRFNELHPNVEIELTASGALADIQNYEVDMGIRYCQKITDDLNGDLISRAPLYPVGKPGLNGSGEGRPDVSELQDFRLLQENHAFLWRLWFEKAGMPDVELTDVSPRLSTMLAIEAALAGQGLLLASEELVANDIAAGRLKRYSDVGLDYGGYYLVYRKSTTRREAAKAFRNWLLDESKSFRM